MEKIMPRRRFQSGRVYLRGTRWVGSYREYEVNPETGKRARRTITFDATVTSERAAKAALQPYLDDYNARAKANLKPSAPRGEKTVRALLEEWTDKILPNRKPGGARAALSHIRAYIRPQLGDLRLRDMNLSQHQAFVTSSRPTCRSPEDRGERLRHPELDFEPRPKVGLRNPERRKEGHCVPRRQETPTSSLFLRC